MVQSFAITPAVHDRLIASPLRLRFELNTGGSPVAMFTMAYDRARALARAALGQGPLAAVVAADPEGWDRPWSAQKFGPRRASGFEVLADMGVAAAPVSAWSALPFAEAEEAAAWPHRAVSIGWAEADLLLWNALAQDLGIRPVAPVIGLLFDAAGTVCVNAYDDRGMDVSALDAARLLPLYRAHAGWLLDFDRPRMAALFGSPVAPRPD